MKLATAINEKGQTFIGLVDTNNSEIINLHQLEELLYGFSRLPKSMTDCVVLNEEFISQVNSHLEEGNKKGKLEDVTFPLDKVKLAAPIPRPRKNIFCVGKNYREHAIEMGSEKDIPENLIVFTKAPTTVIGHLDDIPPHQEATNQLDYEGELAIIIGKTGNTIKREEALDYVFGYTILNDITARDLQSKHKQYFIGKSLDGTCPIGPWIVHKSAISNPANLTIETRVNGEVRQQSSTKQFIFTIEEIIEVLSRGMTLEAGDIIATGTPAGVGKGFNPPRYLKSGDEITISIEKIGILKNKVR